MTSTSRHDVHIIATVVRCSVGLTAASAMAAIRAGVSAVSAHPTLVDSGGERVVGACEPTLSPHVLGTARMQQLAQRGLEQMVRDLGDLRAAVSRLPLMLAIPEYRPGFDEQAARALAVIQETPVGQPAVELEFVGQGHAGALEALAAAVRRVEAGDEVVVAGGVDSYFDAETIAWLEHHRRLARPQIRSGFPPGEGVAFVALANGSTCRRLGVRPLASVRGLGQARELRDPEGQTGVMGEALTLAIKQATAAMRTGDRVTDLYGDINGELVRSHDWGFAALRTSSILRDGTEYLTHVGQCGDLGAATGALCCALATESWRYHAAIGPRALVWGGSWNGCRAAALLEAQAA